MCGQARRQSRISMNSASAVSQLPGSGSIKSQTLFESRRGHLAAAVTGNEDRKLSRRYLLHKTRNKAAGAATGGTLGGAHAETRPSSFDRHPLQQDFDELGVGGLPVAGLGFDVDRPNDGRVK